jgi:hypothetical protein
MSQKCNNYYVCEAKAKIEEAANQPSAHLSTGICNAVCNKRTKVPIGQGSHASQVSSLGDRPDKETLKLIRFMPLVSLGHDEQRGRYMLIFEPPPFLLQSNSQSINQHFSTSISSSQAI